MTLSPQLEELARAAKACLAKGIITLGTHEPPPVRIYKRVSPEVLARRRKERMKRAEDRAKMKGLNERLLQ